MGKVCRVGGIAAAVISLALSSAPAGAVPSSDTIWITGFAIRSISTPEGIVDALEGVANLSPKGATDPVSESVEDFPGTLAVPVGRVAASDLWRHVLQSRPENLTPPTCAPDDQTQACRGWTKWREVVERSSKLRGRQRLQAVHEGVNALVKYSSDREIYRAADHWATLAESVAMGWGDCEDIAIVKMWALVAAGVDPATLRVVVLRDTMRGVDHAVLTVMENDESFLLDNLYYDVMRTAVVKGYRPVYALNTTSAWVFGASPRLRQ